MKFLITIPGLVPVKSSCVETTASETRPTYCADDCVPLINNSKLSICFFYQENCDACRVLRYS